MIADTLGLKGNFHSEMDLLKTARKGIKVASLRNIEKKLGLKRKELASYIHKDPVTIKRTYDSKKLIPSDWTDRIIALARVYVYAVEVFEDEEEALLWLKYENPALEGNTPIELLDTSIGVNMVMNLLGRIEHGIPV